MSWRCCKCKIRCWEKPVGCPRTDEPCYECGYNEYFWYDPIEHRIGSERPKNRNCSHNLNKTNGGGQ